MLTVETIRAEAQAMREWLIAVRRDFHMYPEIGLQEFRTQQRICSYLAEMGMEYDDKCYVTAVVGTLRGGKGKTVGMRADIDALTIQEANEVEYKSRTPGIMHACGHDSHAAVVLGTARLLAKYRSELPGNAKFFFQPAEETSGGAKNMIAAGCLENPAVDYTLSLHAAPDYDAGTIGLKYGQNCASTDEINITVTGKSAHGARPQQGVDAIVIAAQIITALQTIISRNIAATESAVVTIGTIHGGDKANIIAETVVLGGTVRNLTPENRERVLRRVSEVSMRTAEVFGGSAEVVIGKGYAPLVNDIFVTDIIKSSAEEVLGEDKVIIYNEPSLGGEDFSYFAEAVPGAMFRLGVRNEAQGITAGIHNNRFDIDEQALVTGVEVMALSALKLMESDQLSTSCA